VRQALQYCYSPKDAPEQGCLIQMSEDTFERWYASQKVLLELSYRQLWLYDPVLETYVRKGQLYLCEECAGQGPRLEVL
jgi:hypothetical protein